jgi:hypothetical protein
VFTLSVFIQRSRGILEATWNYELEVPGAPLPEAVNAWNPASCCIRRRGSCVYLGYALQSISKIK